MAKYNYDKSALKGLGVSAFLNETKVRKAHIDAGKAEMPRSIFNPNVIAAKLHPDFQLVKVKEIIERKDAKTYVLEPDTENGTKELAYFRAGQYITIEQEFDSHYFCRPYSLSSAPKDALGPDNNTYEITIKRSANGMVSDHILDTWAIGTRFVCSGPLGHFYYQRLRDSKNIIALAGGSGITPFISMARAIADGTEDFNLTIIYGSQKADGILFKKELDECISESNGKVNVIHVLSDDNTDGFEHGFITADLIKKYAPDDYTIYVCGPKKMYAFLEKELTKLELPIRKIRYEVQGEYGDPTADAEYPADKACKTYKLRVWIHGEYTDITCTSEKSLLQSMELAGIRVTSDCRSGKCGWCHSRLINGEIYIAKHQDSRREGDIKFNWIHPCCSYPLSDIELEVFPLM